MESSFSRIENEAVVASLLNPKAHNTQRMAMCDNQPRCKAIKPRAALLRCSGCHSVFYCNAQCQKEHWSASKNGHSYMCAAMAARYKRKLEKRKKQAKKLRKAQKEAEASNSSFNASMTLMFMDSDDDSDSDDAAGGSSTNLGSSRFSFSESAHKEEDVSANKDLGGSLALAGLTLEPEEEEEDA